MSMSVIGLVLLGLIVFDPHRDGGGSDRMEFLDSAGEMCAKVDARDARYQYRARVAGKPELGGSVVLGCWVERGDFVFAGFEDGDTYRIPRQAIDWVK